jgi:putative toxin-antitoxin system antitoxin component (TIGR02293 family)
MTMFDAARIADALGGEAVIGRRLTNQFEFMAAVREGLAVGVVDRLVDDRYLTSAEVDLHVIPRKTLSHRRNSTGRLTREQSDRVVRAAAVVTTAEETFGSRERAGAWLRRPSRALAGSAPIDLIDTDIGAREVEDLLVRIDHGIAA